MFQSGKKSSGECFIVKTLSHNEGSEVYRFNEVGEQSALNSQHIPSGYFITFGWLRDENEKGNKEKAKGE